MTPILSFLKSIITSLIPMKAEYISIALLWIVSLFLVYDYFDDKYDREIERLPVSYTHLTLPTICSV